MRRAVFQGLTKECLWFRESFVVNLSRVAQYQKTETVMYIVQGVTEHWSPDHTVARMNKFITVS